MGTEGKARCPPRLEAALADALKMGRPVHLDPIGGACIAEYSATLAAVVLAKQKAEFTLACLATAHHVTTQVSALLESKRASERASSRQQAAGS